MVSPDPRGETAAVDRALFSIGGSVIFSCVFPPHIFFEELETHRPKVFHRNYAAALTTVIPFSLGPALLPGPSVFAWL